MEPVNHSKNMANLKRILNGGKFLFLFVVIFTFISCSPKLYFVKSTPKQNEISTTPDLRQLLNNKKSQPLSVVLRIPRTASNVTQEIQNNELYNTIEKKLMNTGFVIRDRALLEKLVLNEQLSYESIAEKIKVDLIIEVVENSQHDNIQTVMFCKKNNNKIDLLLTDRPDRSHLHLNLITSKFTFRIVLAETGVSSGFFTFYYTPCTDGCDIYAKKSGKYYYNFNRNKEASAVHTVIPGPYSLVMNADYINDDLSSKIINILQGK
jgi:hypothetical protein